MTEIEPTWLSPAAYRKLVEELETLTTTGRVEIADRIAEARSHGDLRENADYDAAKNEQGLMEARIRQIEQTLRTAEVREVTTTDSVEVGSIVTVSRGEGAEMEFFVAPAENKVEGYMLASPSSPLGAALLGAAIGDSVAYDAPGGTFTVTVTGIRPFEG
jgi:transcription elongation factor GreA